MRCIVSNCNHDSTQTSKEVSYLRLPTEPLVRASWLRSLQMADWELTETSVICSQHFLKEDLLGSSHGLRTVRAGAMPVFDVQVCRICFVTNCKLYPMTAYKILSKTYETLTGLLTENEDNLPRYLCTECARRLLNCARFRTKTLRAHLLLLEIVKNHGYITFDLIKFVKENHSNLTECYNYPQKGIDTDNTANENIYIPKYIDNDAIKDENDDMSNQDVLKTENPVHDNMLHISTLPEYIAAHGIKTEGDDDISQENIYAKDTNHADIKIANENMIELDRMKYSHDDVKTASDIEPVNKCMRNQDIAIENSWNADMDHNDTFVDEADSSYDGRANATGVLRVVKLSTDSNPKRGLDIDNDVIENICVPEYIDNDAAKDESDDTSNQDVLKTEDPLHDNMLHISILPEYITVDGIQIEDDDGISQGIDDKGTSHADVNIVNNIESENINMNNLNVAIEDSWNADIDHVDTLVVYEEDTSADHCAEARQNTELSTTGVLRVYLSTDSKPETDVSLNDNKLSCDVNSYKDNNEIVSRKLKTHLTTHFYSCSVCNYRTITKRILRQHFKIHSANIDYTCDICKKIFYKRATIIRHLRAHSCERPYICDHCGKSFTRQDRLMRHLRIHTGENSYTCKFCNSTFNQRARLKIHSRTHSGVKPYSCNVCNKRFNRKNHLRTHLSIHSGKKQLWCDICKKEYSCQSAFREHLRIHSGEKPYSCNVCCKAFTAQSALRGHIRIHSGEKPYTCKVCNKTFNQKTNLTTHSRIHFGLKPYSCGVCNKSFSRQHQVTNHLRIHTGEKPYSCNVCNKTFNQKTNLTRHLRTHSD